MKSKRESFSLESRLCAEGASRVIVRNRIVATLGSRLRLLREALEMTQEEISRRTVDQDGRVLHQVEVGHVESGRNMASTRRVRTSLARAFGVSEEDMFDYLEGRVPLQEFMKLRTRRRGKAERGEEKKSPHELAIDVIVADGYGTTAEVRRAAARLRETLPAEEQAELGTLEWAKLIEVALRKMRREADPASGSGVVPRPQQGGATSPRRMKGRPSA